MGYRYRGVASRKFEREIRTYSGHIKMTSRIIERDRISSLIRANYMFVYLSYKAGLIHLTRSRIEISLISETRSPSPPRLVSTAEVYLLLCVCMYVCRRKVLSGGHPFSRRRDCSRAPLCCAPPVPSNLSHLSSA